MIYTIIIFLIILSVLVVFHELGHFLFARKFRVKVLEFGLGFPPRAKKLFTDKRGTLFSLNWLPIGGFVAMAGEDEPGETKAPGDSKKSNDSKKDEKTSTSIAATKVASTKATPTKSSPSQEKSLDKKSPSAVVIQPKSKKSTKDTEFYRHPAWQRLIIICAGPIFSFLLGVICFTLLYSVNGLPRNYDYARITEVVADSPAAASGLPAQTGVLALYDATSSEPIYTYPSTQEVIDFAAERRGQIITLVGQACEAEKNTCQSEQTLYQIYIRTPEETPANQGAMGIAFQEQYVVRYPWWQMPFLSAIEGTKQSLWLTWQIILSLGQLLSNLLTGQSIGGDVAGPVGIVTTIEREGLFDHGIWMIIAFSGMLSINLAVMNMLPIPAVDGGRALLIILEKFVSRQRIAKIEGALNTAGFIALLALMAVITINDIVKIFSGG